MILAFTLLLLPALLIYPELARMIGASQDRPRDLLVAWILALGWPLYLWDEIRS